MKHASTLLRIFLFSTLAIFGTIITAHATSHGNNFLFDKPYGNVGKWRILHGKTMGDTCVAEQDNPSMTLRIMHTDYTGDWYIGVPNYNDQPVNGGINIIFGASSGKQDWSDAIRFQTDHANGWALFFFQQNVLKDLRAGSDVELDAGNGWQSWSLAGSSKAIAMVQECARNLGKRPARQKTVQAAPRQNNVQAAPRQNNVQPVQPAYNNAGAQTCFRFGQFAAVNSNQAATVEFFNHSGNPNGALKIYWIDYQGSLVDMAIFDNGRASLNTYVGHTFVVRDRGGNCYGGAYTVQPGHNQFTIR